jgi:hypothetical protein
MRSIVAKSPLAAGEKSKRVSKGRFSRKIYKPLISSDMEGKTARLGLGPWQLVPKYRHLSNLGLRHLGALATISDLSTLHLIKCMCQNHKRDARL